METVETLSDVGATEWLEFLAPVCKHGIFHRNAWVDLGGHLHGDLRECLECKPLQGKTKLTGRQPQAPKGLRFDRRQFDQHRKAPVESRYANDEGKDQHDTYSNSDMRKPSMVHHDKMNPDGVQISEILSGFEDGGHGYSVRGFSNIALGITRGEYLLPSPKVQAAESLEWRELLDPDAPSRKIRFNPTKQTFEPRDPAESGDYKDGLRQRIIAHFSPVIPHGVTWGERAVTAETPHHNEPCRISGERASRLVALYRKRLRKFLSDGRKQQEDGRKEFTAKYWPDQNREFRIEENTRRTSQLLALEIILAAPELRLGPQDYALLEPLVAVRLTTNEKKARRLGYKWENIAPAVPRLILGGDAGGFLAPGEHLKAVDYTASCFNAFAPAGEDKRGRSTIAAWTQRRADDNDVPGKEFILRRKYAEIFGVHLSVFPSEKIGVMLERLSFLWDDSLQGRYASEVGIFLGERPTRRRLVTQYEHPSVGAWKEYPPKPNKATPPIITLSRSLSYSESGRGSITYERWDARPIGHYNVTRTSGVVEFREQTHAGRR